MDKSKRIEHLEWQLKSLAEKQNYFNDNIIKIQRELNLLKQELELDKGSIADKEEPIPTLGRSEIPKQEKAKIQEEPKLSEKASSVKSAPKPVVKLPPTGAQKFKRQSSQLEQYIGSNVILIGGIIVLVIGLAFGVKYSIDNDLLSPSVRIILGYLAALGLLGFAYKLREKYENFSAVLLAGACSSLYIITYVAFDSYGFFNRPVTFVLMLLFTVFTVISAIQYNRQIIAQLGLVGAYAIPFLTSQDSGNIPVLMTYITIVNLGILFVAYKRNWRSLNISSFVISWLLYSLSMEEGFYRDFKAMSFVFANVFYLIFFAMLLSYKFLKKESMNVLNVIMLAMNTIFFFGFGYVILDDVHTNDHLGLFTILVAFYNFIPAYKIFKEKSRNDNLIYVLGVTVITFLTLAIPVQLDGNWVTLFWASEAALFLWLSIKKKLKYFDTLALVVTIIAFLSFIEDLSSNAIWMDHRKLANFKAVFNLQFLSGVIFTGIFVFMSKLVLSKDKVLFPKRLDLPQLLNFIIPILTFITVMLLGVNEIGTLTQKYVIGTQVSFAGEYSRTLYDQSVRPLSGITIYLYMVFVIMGLWVMAKWRKVSEQTDNLFLGMKAFLILFFVLGVLPHLNTLGLLPFHGDQEYFSYGHGLVILRYPIIALTIYIAISIYRTVKRKYAKTEIEVISDIALYTTLLITLGFELLLYMKAFVIPEPYKLGLSILGGVYTIYLILRGIFARKSHLRFMGFILLGLIIIKLFFYDIAHLKTLSKTIIFVSLGICMLVSSFLYNKHKAKLFDDE